MRRCNRLWEECWAVWAFPDCENLPLPKPTRMNIRSKSAAIISTILLSAIFQAQTNPKASPMTLHATGPFEAKVTPIHDDSADSTLSRMSLDKQYHGGLEATARGQMLAAGSPAKGAGGYVAIEKVTGTLNGKTGSFALQHSGTMTNNRPELIITIVPGSGTGELEGISGKMTITISPDGKHSYDLEYTLPKHV
jgi:hypothetical protein